MQDQHDHHAQHQVCVLIVYFIAHAVCVAFEQSDIGRAHLCQHTKRWGWLAEWVDEQVVVDGQLISSRKPDDIPAFSQALIDALSA